MIQSFGSGGSADVQVDVETISLTTTDEKAIVYITFPSISGKTVGVLNYTAFKIWLTAGANFNASTNSLGNQSGTLNISEIEIYTSSKELPVRRPTPEEALKLCSPYGQWGTVVGGGSIYSSGDILREQLVYKTTMIQIPSVTMAEDLNNVQVDAALVTDVAYIGLDVGRVNRDVSTTSTSVLFVSRYFLEAEL